jgi:3-oxoacyl-ACP reductase-like protein
MLLSRQSRHNNNRGTNTMAKKETNKAPEAAAAASAATAPTAAAPAAAPKPVKKPDVFTFVKQVDKDGKLAPQARVIVNVMENLKSANREELVKALIGKLQTRQPEGRILTYYQKTLVEAGYITITEVE